jgi:SnoaL-like polyketide cyclase
MCPVEATGKRVRFSGVNIFRFGGGGKVIEVWNHRDDLGLMEQLGASVFAGATPSARAPTPSLVRSIVKRHSRRWRRERWWAV